MLDCAVDVEGLVSDITFIPGWGIHTNIANTFLQVFITRRHLPTLWCREWPLTPSMTKSEIVQTAFMAIMAAQEHETREAFKYKGKAIFGPHFDVDDLWEIAQCLP